MISPMYVNSVPVFKQLLNALKGILVQADAHVVADSIEPDAFLQARLYPNMFPLVKQVQIAADFARGISARLAGVAVPVYEGKEKTFADLDKLLAQTLEYIEGVDAAKFAAVKRMKSYSVPVRLKEKKLSGQAYLTNYGLPQFLFHVPPPMRFCVTTGCPSVNVISSGVY